MRKREERESERKVLISTDGYVVVDDTGHPQFDNSMDWPWVVNQSLPAASSASCSAVDVSKVTNSVKFSILLYSASILRSTQYYSV